MSLHGFIHIFTGLLTAKGHTHVRLLAGERGVLSQLARTLGKSGHQCSSNWASCPGPCLHCCTSPGILEGASVLSPLSREVWLNKGEIFKQGSVGLEVGLKVGLNFRRRGELLVLTVCLTLPFTEGGRSGDERRQERISATSVFTSRHTGLEQL